MMNKKLTLMRTLIVGAMLALSTFTYGQDYYWVGGSGDWSDPDQEHWATTSGGTTFHTTPPTATNDVYFDVNSFPSIGSILTIDIEADCKSMDWSAVANNPTVAYTTNDLNVYGSFTLSSDMSWEHRNINFESSSTGNTITTGNISFPNRGRDPNVNFRFSGSGTYTLEDSVKNLNNLFVSNLVTLDLNSQYLESNTIGLYGSGALLMGDATIVTPLWENQVGSPFTLDAGTSRIYASGTFDNVSYASTLMYNLVYFEGNVSVSNRGFTADSLIIQPATEVEFLSSNTVTVNQLVAVGDEDNPITMKASTPGTAATISQATGTVEGEWLVLQDIEATGSVPFEALNSIDNGNNSGWTITEPIPDTYYWVGGTGLWSDPDQEHWATESGGETFYTQPPNRWDNVIFDENSFPATGAIVTMDTEASCLDMDWSNATNHPTLDSNGDELYIYGSLTLTKDMTWDDQNIFFVGTGVDEIITTDNITFGGTTRFTFEDVGSYQLMDSIKNLENFSCVGGTIDLNGQYIEVTNRFYTDADLLMGDAEVHTVDFIAGASLDAGTSSIHVTEQFVGGVNNTFNQIFIEQPSGSRVLINGMFNADSLILQPGTVAELLGSSTTITVNYLVANGTKTNPIDLSSSLSGTAATISQASGTVDATYLILQDITATGGATFNATQSIDNGGNTGWNITAPTPQVYYWVGGSGTWSDYENHWATTSGGTTFHTGPPADIDHVYFDASSFPETGATVTIDEEAICHDMDWSAVTNAPTVEGSSRVNIHGSLTLAPDMSWGEVDIDFESEEPETITTANLEFEAGIAVDFNGTATYTLQDSLKMMGAIDINQGTLDLNNQYVRLAGTLRALGSSTLLMRDSEVYTGGFTQNSAATVDAGTSDLYIENGYDFTCAGGTFNRVFIGESAGGNVSRLTDAFVADSLILLPGAVVTFPSAETITVNQLVAEGPINLSAYTSGTAAIISQATGTVNATFLTLQDIAATGGAIFTATESFDNGNNANWTITGPTPKDYYWVGGSGSWNDYANHWATTSGGNTFHYYPPTRQDSVYFDAGSFTTPDEVVTIAQEAECARLVAEGSLDHSLFLEQDITIYGDLLLDESATINKTSREKVNLRGSSDHFLKMMDQNIGLENDARVHIYSGSYGLGEKLISYAVYVENGGHLDTKGHDVDMGYLIAFPGSSLSIDNSTLEIGVFEIEVATTFSGEGSTIYFKDNFVQYLSIQNDINGNPYLLDEVIFPAKVYEWPVVIETDVSAKSILFESGSEVQLGNNDILTATESLTLAGTESAPVTVYTQSATTSATIDASAATTVSIDYAHLTDLTSVSELTARYSTDNGGNVNFIFPAIEFPSLEDQPFGIAPFELEAIETGAGGTVTYTSSDEAVATVEGSTVTLTGIGTTTLTASAEGAFDVSQDLTVIKGDQDLTFEELTAVTYGDGEADLTGTSSSGLELAYNSSDETVATVSGSTVIILAAGQTTITASQAGDDRYNAATDVTQTLTVNPKALTVTADDQEKVFGEALPALTVSFAGFVQGEDEGTLDVMPELATIADETSDVGEYDITFTVEAVGDNYAVTSVPGKLIVTPAPQTLTWGTLEDVDLNGGSTTVDLTGKVTSSAGLEVTISLVSGPATLDGNILTLDGTTGTVILQATQAGGGNYQAAPNKTASFNVIDTSLDDQVITFGALTAVRYGDGLFDLTATSDSGLPVSYTSSDETVATVAGSTVTIVGAGETTITASQEGDADYNPAVSVAQELTVNKALLTVTPTDAEKVYGADLPDFTFTYTGFVPGEDATEIDETPVVTTNATKASPVGTYLLKIEGGSDDNYSFVYVEGELTVTKAPLTMAVVNGSKTYGAAVPTFELTYTGFVLEENTSVIDTPPTVTTAATETSVVGIYAVTLSDGEDNNYTFVYDENGTLEVTPATLRVTVDANQSKVYGAEVPALTYSYAGFVLNENEGDLDTPPSVTTTATETSVVGEYPVTLSGGVAENYTFVNEDGKLDVTPAPLKVTINDATKVFGEDLPTNLGFTYQGFVLEEDESVLDVMPVITTTANVASNVGEYDLTFRVEAADANYEVESIPGTLTVTPAAQTLTWNTIADVDLQSGTTTVDLSGQVTSSAGLEVVIELVSGPATLEGEILTLDGTTGTVILQATQAGGGNYQAAPNKTTSFNVIDTSLDDQVITFGALTAVRYGDASFDLSATSDSGLEVSYTSSDETVATVTGSTVTIVGAGQTTITASQEGNADFNPATAVAQELTVNQKTLTVTAEDQEIVYGEAIPTLTYIYAGFVSGEDETDLFITPVATTEADQNSDAGEYEITVSGGLDDNYAFEYEPGTLTILQATQTITWQTLNNVDLADNDLTVDLTNVVEATSGLSVTVEVLSGPATLSGTTLTLDGTTGTVVLQASQAGNTNYLAAAEVTTSFNVTDTRKADQEITFEALTAVTFGAAAFDLTATTTAAGLTVSYTSSDETVATVTGSTVTIVGAGETTITAYQGGDEDTNPATPVSQVLTVSKATPMITFEALDVVELNQGTLTLTATTTSTEAVSYTSSDVMVATVSGNTVTLLALGTTTITASVAEGANYTAATASQELEVVERILGLETQSLLTIYPNPASDYLKIKGDYQSLTIRDLQGRAIRTYEMLDGDVLSIEDLSSGTYLLEYEDDQGVQHTIRFMKKE